MFSLSELENIDVISHGWTDNLLIEDDSVRVWLARTGIEDGEPYNNKVTVEYLINGRWEVHSEYEAK